MVKYFKETSFCLIICLCQVSAFANILVEPHIGYNISGNANYPGGALTIPGVGTAAVSSFKDSYSGFQYGGRLGFQYIPGLLFGFDYNI